MFYVFRLDLYVPFGEAWFWATLEYTVVHTQTCQHLIP